MKAVARLLAVLLILSCTAFAQTVAASTSPAEPADARADAAPTAAATPFAAGAKLYLEPMDTFEQLLAAAIVKKKVPVVLVHDREMADFVMSGDARVVKPGFAKGLFVDPHGQASFSVKDAHTGEVVFSDQLKQPGSWMTVGQIYLSEADACAKHLKKALVKK